MIEKFYMENTGFLDLMTLKTAIDTKADMSHETPIRVINSPAQVAMLQDVLSMALNKIE